MEIQDITVYTYDANYSFGTYTMSGGRSATGQPSIVVRIRTKDGIEGWAETAPLDSNYLPSSFTGELAALKELGPHVLGLDPRSPAAINVVMDRIMMGGTAAKAVIDIACWDILGKAVGLPTSTLLGGCLTESPPAFAVIPVEDPEAAVKQALEEVTKGLTALQLKVGDNPLSDARRVRAIREAVPETVQVWADANAGWNLEQALTFARALGQDVAVQLEQPCRALSDCAEFGRRTGIPVVLDESAVTMADLVAGHAAGVTGVNIKSSRVGGFTKARAMRDAAVALDVVVVVDDPWGGALTTAQNLQIAASTRPDRLRAVDLFAEWTKPLVAPEVPRMQSNGRVSRTTAPGNGVGEVDMGVLGEPLFQIA
ncbi:o-succinylbenzoate synthase [Colletotrichum karsti]|uniref:O-succinylbenzoate synthase n=1 Tax=Colletotrichum karsti TaxID=1095194 RepID=A0A9P6LM38_9PEZI|nr:o-succinylbenzoate synthase [Colletotrichum karsti]KAF9877172.1 o-succinylbenzoate synthase [Colletotrichum karsti]